MALGHLAAVLVSRRHPRVLFVDDEPAGATSLCRTLAAVRPRWVFTGVSGLEWAIDEMRRWPPDVVVTELNPSPMPALELLREVAHAFPTTARIVYSARQSELLVASRSDIVHVVLHKPASTEQLVEALEQSVELSLALQRRVARMSRALH